MIRIIKDLTIRAVGTSDEGYMPLRMIPASGTLEMTDERDKNGRLTTYDISLKVQQLPSSLRAALRNGSVVRVQFDGCIPPLPLGTDELPVHFTIEDALDFILLSAKWKCASRM